MRFPLALASAALAMGPFLQGCNDPPPPPAKDAHVVAPSGGDSGVAASFAIVMASPAPSVALGTGTGTEETAAHPAMITARHVLIQYMGSQHAGAAVVRTKEQALSVAQEVLRRAKAGEDFARLAVEYSDEPGSASRGGSLGRFGHGQMVHEFDDAAFALAPGQISGVVETPFGFHIIQRTE
jgi:hypothetical protein